MERRALDRRRWCTPHLCGVAGGGADSGWARRVSWRRRRRPRPRYAVRGGWAHGTYTCSVPPGASSPAPQARVRPIHAPHMHVTDGLWLYMSAWLLTGAKGEAHQHVELREVLPNEGEGAVVVGQVLVAARLTW